MRFNSRGTSGDRFFTVPFFKKRDIKISSYLFVFVYVLVILTAFIPLSPPRVPFCAEFLQTKGIEHDGDITIAIE